MQDQLSFYLTFLGPAVSDEHVTWGRQVLRVRSYLTQAPPPVEFVTSVRCVVMHDDTVLVVHDPDEIHIIPGGRRNPGETLVQTALREVREETGWTVTGLRQLGVKHFQHLSPKAANHAYPFPNFLQLIYLAEALCYDAAAIEDDGYELSAEFHPVTSTTIRTLRMSDRHFLAAARRVSALAQV